MRKLYLILILWLSVSCSNFLDVEPMGKLIPEEVEDYENLLNNLNTINYFLLYNNTCYLATLGDNLEISENQARYQYNDIGYSAINTYTSYTFQQPYYDLNASDFYWDNAYETIGIYNSLINGVNDVATESNSAVANSLIAQAKAARAWTYLNLGLVYGPMYNPNSTNDTQTIPYRTESQPLVANPDRATTAELFQYVKQDIDDALTGIPETVGNPCRFGLPALHMLMSYYYMYMRDWNNMLTYANMAWDEVLAQRGSVEAMLYNFNNFSYDLDESVVIGDDEVNPKVDLALQGEDNLIGQTTHRENIMYRKAAINGTIDYPSEEFLNLFDQEKDLRYDLFALRDNGFSSEINGETYSDGLRIYYFRDEKMLSNEGYTTSELLLLRAEAYARTGALPEALNALNLLRQFRYKGTTTAETDLPNGASLTQDELLEEILNERRRELPIGTYQHFLDIKRYALDTGKPWCKTSITHQIGNQTYTADVDGEAFILPISNIVIQLNPQWGIPVDGNIFNPSLYQ